MRTLERERQTVPAWRALVRGAAVVDFLLLAGTAVALTDVEAGGFAVVTLALIGLLHVRKGTIGTVLLGLLFADVTYWMAGGAIDNLRHGEGIWETAVPAALAIASIAGMAGVVGTLAGRGERAARPVEVVAVLAFVAVLVTGILGANGEDGEQAGEIELTTKDVKFSDTSLEARSGEMTVAVSNGDLFWHTFTVPELGVNVNLPVGANRRAVFRATPGTYEFVCIIGPHERLGMRGTLTVR